VWEPNRDPHRGGVTLTLTDRQTDRYCERFLELLQDKDYDKVNSCTEQLYRLGHFKETHRPQKHHYSTPIPQFQRREPQYRIKPSNSRLPPNNTAYHFHFPMKNRVLSHRILCLAKTDNADRCVYTGQCRVVAGGLSRNHPPGESGRNDETVKRQMPMHMRNTSKPE
jgi:hypothetical protein